ncbi:MAG TPA: type III PLP-dependent enzyme [Acidimicrobiia bacterium]|nr:type III PLP-dependent enzyme [Acidimicrobiia bacterium]
MPNTIDLRLAPRPQAWPHALAPARLDLLTHPTPFLICDGATIERRYEDLSDLLPGVRLYYAVKSNPMPQVVDTLAGIGCGFEIASIYELDTVMAAGVRPSEVLFSNPVKPAAHIAEAAAAGLYRFVFDSEGELRKLAANAPGSSVYVRLAVDDEHSVFPLSRKFGTTAADAVRLLLLVRDLGLVPYGITFHVGSQCTDPLAWVRAIERCGAVMAELAPSGIRLEMLDLGGGIPARYVAPVPTLAGIAAAIERGLRSLPYQPRHIAAEPGRSLVAESGVMVATVIGVEMREDERWAYLDVGGYNGMMEAVQTGGRWPFPILTSCRDPREPSAGAKVRTTVTGPSCDSSDTMFYGVPLPASLAAGDRLYIGSAGAYTTSYASSFNGFPPPATLFRDGRRRIRRPAPVVSLALGA